METECNQIIHVIALRISCFKAAHGGENISAGGDKSLNGNDTWKLFIASSIHLSKSHSVIVHESAL